ncbi:MAG: NERD domain-containing protein [Firmicutes bacterium]|nr:NERD domain-containing protein [Bacillota bacterium]
MDYLIYGSIGLAVIIILWLLLKSKKQSNPDSELVREIGKSDPKKDYYVLSGIEFHDGVRSAKIDHLIINPSGIHAVLEYLHDGYIEGFEQDHSWSFEYKGVSDSFDNPIHTARLLKQSIDKVLKKDLPIFLYVVFPKDAELPKKRMPLPVIHSDELNDYLDKNFRSKKRISSNDVIMTYELFNKVKNN